jgi:hypothetical protein
MNKKLIEQQLEWKFWVELRKNFEKKLGGNLLWYLNDKLWWKIHAGIKLKFMDDLERQLNENEQENN